MEDLNIDLIRNQLRNSSSDEEYAAVAKKYMSKLTWEVESLRLAMKCDVCQGASERVCRACYNRDMDEAYALSLRNQQIMQLLERMFQELSTVEALTVHPRCTEDGLWKLLQDVRSEISRYRADQDSKI